MAEFSLPPPAPFLPVPGEPPIPWASWIDGITVYLEAMDYDDIPDRRKIALLRHCLGAEGQRIYRALGEAETYEEAVALLAHHFTGQQRVILRRYKLRKRLQRPGESVQDYVTNLRDMARSCNYGTLQDQIVRDQFIEGILCDKTREKLLLEPDELTLNQAVVIALQVEAALECSTLLADARPPVDVSTQQLRSSCHSGHCHLPTEKTEDNNAGFPVQLAQLQRNQRSLSFCGNCGSSLHNSRAQNCPARGQTCRKCLKKITLPKFAGRLLLHKQHGGDPHLSVMTTLRSGMYQLARQLSGHVLCCWRR